jgi:hypothetical protein
MQKIRFLHIPKTGGSTLYAILRRQYLFQKHAHLYGRDLDAKEYSRLSERDRQHVSLVLGHTVFFTGLPEIDALPAITIIRDPVERVKSFCQHIWEGKSAHLVEQFPPYKFDLEQLLESDCIGLRNFQTYVLASREPIEQFSSLSPQQAAELYDLALERLVNQILCFGLNEYFDESLMMFSAQLNWRLPPVYIIRNSKNRRHALQFEPQHIDQIRAMNAIDIQVYEAAKTHFLKKLASPDFDSAKLQRFQRLKQQYSRFMHRLPAAKRLPPPFDRLVSFLR